MPGSRQRRQHNPLTRTNARKHLVSTCQRCQQYRQIPLTLLTGADTRQHSETAGRRILLTLLTVRAPPRPMQGRTPHPVALLKD